MLVTAVSVRSFRNYDRAQLALAEHLTVLVGPNGAGKTNLLEAAYVGCTGRSPRSSNERELVRRGSRVARVEVLVRADDGEHRLEVGLEPAVAKVQRVDGATVDSLAASTARPPVVLFLPERLELVKGAPSVRRAHLDALVAALWPARAETRAAYSRALAQRNALLVRIRAGTSSADSLPSWDAELAEHGARLIADRTAATGLLAPRFAERARELGLPEDATLAYRPRSRAVDATGLAAELAERRGADVARGFTAHGPHRDEVTLRHAGESLRSFGSQGQQRVAVLALLFAERDLLLAERGSAPLMLLDDVMSELDAARRELLVELLATGGQTLLTTTDLAHLPAGGGPATRVYEITAGTATLAAEGAPA